MKAGGAAARGTVGDREALARDLSIGAAALALAAVAGIAAGVVRGWEPAAAGFVWMPLHTARAGLRALLAAALVFAALFALLRRPIARRLRGRGAGPSRSSILVASGLAALPLVAAGGYALNRELGIRPAQLLERYALPRNLLYLAACAAAWGLVAWLLRRRLAAPPPPPASWQRAAAAALAVFLLVEAGHAVVFRGTAKPRPDVLILLVDGLRPDRLGAYGHSRATSPAIDRLARDGVVFRQAISQSTFTKTSIASLFTGRNPYRHGVYWGNNLEQPGRVTSDVLRREETTLAELLARRGYLTGAWVQNSHLRDFMGFAQGFQVYRDQEGPIERIHRRFGSFLSGPGRRYPFFAYLHYIDLHDPYRPPPPYDTMFGPRGAVYDGVDFADWGAFLAEVEEGKRALGEDELRQLRDLYDGQIRRIDERVGELLDRLRRLGLYDRMLIVLTADHGEAFLEHGFISHSAAPYDELVRVPLIVKFPAGRFAGGEVAEQVRLVDLFPTVAEEAGVSEALDPGQPREVDGCALQPLLRGAARDARCAVAVSEIAEDGAYPSIAVRSEGWKLVHRPGAEDALYDLERDPGETANVAGRDLPQEERLRQGMREALAERTRLDNPRIELDERLIRELKALGYLR
ncbi:MAG TPA: sulfatase [Thermoanaerobaculia bacterium]|nr:sulfatase [Thermoanaerobaculia bacterium]